VSFSPQASRIPGAVSVAVTNFNPGQAHHPPFPHFQQRAALNRRRGRNLRRSLLTWHAQCKNRSAISTTPDGHVTTRQSFGSGHIHLLRDVSRPTQRAWGRCHIRRSDVRWFWEKPPPPLELRRASDRTLNLRAPLPPPLPPPPHDRDSEPRSPHAPFTAPPGTMPSLVTFRVEAASDSDVPARTRGPGSTRHRRDDVTDQITVSDTARTSPHGVRAVFYV
jgi:hypothetical protein